MVRTEKDCGEAVRVILSHPEDFIGQEVVLGHNLLTVQEQADIVQKISGKKTVALPGTSLGIPVRITLALGGNCRY